MSHLMGEAVCALCGAAGPCFSLSYAHCPELPDGERERAAGCEACLHAGRFEFWHDTEIGMLDETGLTHVYKHNREPPADFSLAALVELRRTPRIITWQQEIWLTHCRDFMIYQGTWDPADFRAHAPDGDGKRLFREMTDDEDAHLWEESLADGESDLDSWHAAYYVFRCAHCGKLRGNWDCD